MKTLHEVDFNRANALLEKCGSPHYGLHFGIENKNVFGMTDGEIYDFMFKQTQIFKERLKVPLLLENIPDSIKHRTVFDVYSSFDHRYFNKFIFDNDVFFLLDLMHAKISAVFNGWDVKQYLESLPLKRIREIHVNGSGFDEKGNVEDTHQSMEPEDYTLLEWVLARTNPDIVTLEYSGVKGESVDKVRENLIVQLYRLNAAIKSA